MPSIKFVCDQDLFLGLHFQDTFDTSRLNAPILLSFSNGMNTVLLQTPISYCIDSMGCLVTCFGMTGFSSWLFKPCLKQTMHYSSKALIKPIISWSDVVVFQTSPWEDKRSFMIGTPIFFLFTAADFTLWMIYLSGFALHSVHLPWGFLSYQYFSSTLYESFSLLRPLHEVWNASFNSYASRYEMNGLANHSFQRKGFIPPQTSATIQSSSTPSNDATHSHEQSGLCQPQELSFYSSPISICRTNAWVQLFYKQ